MCMKILAAAHEIVSSSVGPVTVSSSGVPALTGLSQTLILVGSVASPPTSVPPSL
jgi:hypothetical protein